METKKQRKHRKKWLSWIAIACVVALLAALPMLAAGKEDTSSIQASILSAQAQRRDVDRLLIGGGQLSSTGVTNLKIPENVKLTRFLVGNGDAVKEGEKIAEVDTVSVMKAISEVQNVLTELSSQISSAGSSSGTEALSAKVEGRIKKIYAKPGDAVQDVMLEYGALAVLSLDDTMAVKLETDSKLNPGDKVEVLFEDGTQTTGRVKSMVNRELVVTMEDNHYQIGTTVTLRTSDGKRIGTGALYVYYPWNVTAYSGTVSSVAVQEESKVYQSQTILTVSALENSAEYQKLVDQRRKYEALMQELFQLYDVKAITAPCDGIVSGIDTDGAYLLSALDADEQPSPVFLSNLQLDETVQIITEALSPGTMGAAYLFQLQASDGIDLLEGQWAADGLPGGLYLDNATGILYGTPAVSGTFPVKISFSFEEELYLAEYELVIQEKEIPAVYSGYLAQVMAAGGDAIQVKQTETAISISDPDKLPNVTPDPSAMTQEAIYTGEHIAAGGFSQGDWIWLIVDGEGQLCKAVKIEEQAEKPSQEKPSGDTQIPSGSSGSRPSTGGSFSSGSFGGMSGSSSGGMSGNTQTEDSLYTLESLTVATVTSQEHMTVTVTIDELDITKIYVGQTAKITMNSFASQAVDAVVTAISNSGENSGGNSKFTVELELTKSSDMLPGMNATASITLETAENALCVPAAALYEKDGKTIVYTSYDGEKGMLGNPTPVTLGASDADYVQILSGLEEGATVYYEYYEENQGMVPPGKPI